MPTHVAISSPALMLQSAQLSVTCLIKILPFFYEPHKSLSKAIHKVFPGSVPSEFPWPPLGVIPHWSEQLMSLGSRPAFPHYPCHPTSTEPTFQHVRYALIMP